MIDFRDEIQKLLQKELQKGGVPDAVDVVIEIPPDPKLGDYAVPCFPFAKILKKAPQQIAIDLAQKILPSLDKKKFIALETVGSYLNFFTNKTTQTKTILDELHKQKGNYGKQCWGKTIMIEFSSPNTNKPLHLGHVRNICLGDSLSRIHTFVGNTVIKACVVNDRGVHICKSMLAYQKLGKGQTPKSAGMKGDFFVVKCYVEFSKLEDKDKDKDKDKNLEEEAQELLKKWENGDTRTIALWKKMNRWVYTGFKETYKRLGITFDAMYYESDLYREGREIVLEGVKKGICKEEEGAILVDLESFGFGKKVLIRSDGTTLYITQDIYLAAKKFSEYRLDESVYVVGSEQNLHFQQLFKILELLQYPWAKHCFHLSYGMVYLPEGKMKSREGKVVDADDIIKEMIGLAEFQIKTRHKDISEAEVKKRSERVGLSALKFFMLRIDPHRDMTYNPEESIAFEGETGPYVQYTYARIQSILRKHGGKVSEKINYDLFSENEVAIIKDIECYKQVVGEAAMHKKPSVITRYLVELCQKYNEFYHHNPVLSETGDVKEARLLLSRDVGMILKSGISLLGVDVVEEM